MKRLALCILASSFLLAGFTGPAAANAPTKGSLSIDRAKLCRALPEAAPVRLGFRNAPVIDVAQFFACISGRVVVAEIDLKKFSLDLHTPAPVPYVEARRLWLKALRKVGLDLLEREGVWIIERLFV